MKLADSSLKVFHKVVKLARLWKYVGESFYIRFINPNVL
jgi:hypothetical protein